MTNREKLEKVIKGLEHCGQPTVCDGCPYKAGMAGRCFTRLKTDALELLKAQEPRVMTLEEVTEDCPDVVWFDDRHFVRAFAALQKNENYHGWVKFIWRDGFERHDHIDGYGKEWRCWTSKPTDEQRMATPWN